MGNSSSSSGRGHHDDTVDFGHLVPQGVYTGPRDWNQAIVSQLICARRLAPFYRPLEDFDESWDDDQILAARKELPDPDAANLEQTTRIEATASATNGSSAKAAHAKRPSVLKEPAKPEAAVYRGAVECPICFLYYPPNINHSRCCDQAICTECFVQIKRSEPTTTHLVSEPAACPYCVQDNFGVVYNPPSWRAGIGSDGTASSWADSPKGSQQSINTASSYPTHKRRQKSFGADSPEVVTTDAIRPDWESKLAAVRAAVTRRANRRIIMRQVGDRLIPVGVTSGRVHALSPEEAEAADLNGGNGGGSNGNGGNNGSRRSRRERRQQAPAQGYEQYIGLGGPDLEELMMMEAMRLSLLEHEEYQRKEAEEKKKKDKADADASQAQEDAEASTSSPISAPSTSASTLIQPATSSAPTLTAHSSSPSSSPPITLPTITSSTSALATAALGSASAAVGTSISSSPPSQPSNTSNRSNRSSLITTLQAKRASLTASRSRSRSPSPSPSASAVGSIAALHAQSLGQNGGDSNSNSNRRFSNPPSNPPPFSTLTAALSTSSTASAVLGSAGSADSSSGADATTVNSDSDAGAGAGGSTHIETSTSPIPTITIGSNGEAEGAAETHASHTATSTEGETETPSPSRPIPLHVDSTFSAVSVPVASYEQLASSASEAEDEGDEEGGSPVSDNSVSREPLLHDGVSPSGDSHGHSGPSDAGD